MRIPTKLADDDHPLVRATAQRLTRDQKTPRDALRALFHFVRDEIRFGYPTKGDIVKASETIRLGLGQCNTKATLLVALARAAGLEARTHFSTIDKNIQRGIFPGWIFERMPDELSHSWVEVLIEGRGRQGGSYGLTTDHRTVIVDADIATGTLLPVCIERASPSALHGVCAAPISVEA